MRIHTLRPAEGAVTPAKRLGRGTGSGLGKTAARGTRDNGRAAAAEYVPVSRAARCL